MSAEREDNSPWRHLNRYASPPSGLSLGGAIARVLVFSAVLAGLETLWRHTGRVLLVGGVAGAVALLFAAWAVVRPGRLRALVAGRQTMVALLVVLILASIAGTLVVQEGDVAGADAARRLEGFARRQGFFVYRLLHRAPRVRLSAGEEAYFSALAERFGLRYAAERRDDYLRARSAEVRGREFEAWLGRARPWLYAAYGILGALRITAVYRSWWFGGLLAALGLSAAGCVAGRLQPLRRERLGLIVLHLGVVVLLVGAVLRGVFRREGRLFFDADRRTDSFLAADGTTSSLGFALVLKAAHTDYRRQLFCSFPGPGGVRVERAFRVGEGEVIRLGGSGGGYRIVVEEFMPNSRPSGRVEEISSRLCRPAAVVRIERPGRPVVRRVLAARPGRYFTAPDGSFKVRFLFARSADEYYRCLVQPEEEFFGFLRLRLEGGEDGVEPEEGVDGAARMEAKIKVGGSGQRTVCRLAGHVYRVEILDLRLPTPGCPAVPGSGDGAPSVLVRLVGPAGRRVERWIPSVSPSLPRFPPLQVLPGLWVDFIFEGWSAPTPERYVLVGGVGMPFALRVFLPGREPMVLPLLPARPTSVAAAGTTFTLERFIGEAEFPLEPAPPPRDVLSELSRPGQPGLRLRVEGPSGASTVWLRANTPGWDTCQVDDQLRLEYRDNLQVPPIRYRALVAVREGDREVLERVVEVNRPLRFRGFTFYQVDPEYRWMLVVRDPSLPVVYTGLLMLLGGTVAHMLIVRALRWVSGGGTPPEGESG